MSISEHNLKIVEGGQYLVEEVK